MFLQKFILHPFLISAFPVLMIYLINIGETPLSHIFIPLIISITTACFYFIIIYFITKNKYKSGLLTTIFIFLFFSFGHINDLINYYINKYEIQLIIWGIIFIFTIILILKSKSSFIQSTGILNIFGIFLILLVFIQISFYHIKKINTALKPHEVSINNISNDSIKLNDSKHPDVYYIILDGYARNDILKSVYSFDNSEFTNFLSDKGFYIAQKSRANYVLTPLSIASSLNMEYLDSQIDKIYPKSNDMHEINEMIYNNKVMLEFKKLGYKTIFFNTIWGITGKIKSIDEIIDDKKFNQFSIMIIYTTILAPFMETIGINNNERNRILTTFTRLSEIPKQKYATFTFAHIIIPHPPYLFDKDGKNVSKTDYNFKGNAWQNKDLYINQLIFLNHKMMDLLGKIILGSKFSPIIIIQADHGSASSFNKFSWESSDINSINERTGIFNAYLIPGEDKNKLYQYITPVNSFRLIFNELFKKNIKLLNDETYFSSYEKPYKLHNVSNLK